MAGKTKKRGGRNRPLTPKSPTGMMDSPLKGHLGIKSGPFAPTDAKLTSQYMILDHMNAHYRNLSKAKSAVDCSAPKAWQVSQKVRDQARREALKRDMKRRNDWQNNQDGHHTAHSYASSEADRNEMFAMLQSYQKLPEAGPDELDGRHAQNSVHAHASSSSAYKPGSKDLQLISQMVEDPHTSPSKYHTATEIRSNIPATESSHKGKKPSNAHRPHTPRSTTYQLEEEDHGYYYPTSARGQKPLTPRSGDLLEQHNHKFNKPDKPFAPRILKSNNAQSRISTLKCYNPPKKPTTPREEAPKEEAVRKENGKATRTVPPKPVPRDRRGSADLRSTRGSMRGQSRPGTPYSEVDWMNETLMSRDGSQAATPAGVPALDISLDADHVKWLKEQTRKAHVRSSARSRSEVDDLGSTWGSHRAGKTQPLGDTRSFAAETHHMNGTSHAMAMSGTHERPHGMSMSGSYEGGRQQFTLSGSIKSTGYIPKATKSARVEQEEEELKYLEFIQDVTNDVLDRNIYTNRVLKNVFESHIEKRKHELRISKMREMLDDLRLDLGIPDSDDEDSMGLKSTLDFSVHPEQSHARRKARTGKHHPSPSASKLPNLRHTAPKRSASPDAKPPLPRPGSRGSTRGLHGSNEFRTSFEEPNVAEDLTATETGSSTFGMVTALQTNEQTAADVLTIDHAEDETDGAESKLNGNQGQGQGQEESEVGQGDTVKGQDDTDKGHADTDKEANEDDNKKATADNDDEYEMPPKFKLVDDMTLSYQYALEDTLDDDGVSDGEEEEEAGGASNMQTLAPIMEVDTPKEKSPRVSRPTPKQRSSLTPRTDPLKDTPRSQARTNTTSESIDISELDEDEQDDF